MTPTRLTSFLCEQVARVGEVLASPKRQEILELLALAQARRGEVVVIDVRAPAGYAATHLPFARSMPLLERPRRLAELPRDVEIVACRRGPCCLMSNQAVALLRRHGDPARKTTGGVAAWEAAGRRLPSATFRA